MTNAFANPVLFFAARAFSHQGNYDGIVDGVYVFEFFDGDIARLEHFRQGIEDRDVQCRVCCFPFQVSLVKSVLGDRVEIDTYEPKTVMEALGAE